MKLSSILSLAAAIGTTTFTSAQHHNLPPTDTSKFNGIINSPTNSFVPNDVDVIAADAVAVDEADDVSRKLHDDNKHDMLFAMIENVMEEEFGLTAADGDDGGRRLSKSNKSGKGIDPEDKVLGFAFIVVGFLELGGIIDEDDGTAFLTQLSLALTTGDEGNGMNSVRKLMEGAAILDKDDIKKNIQRIIKDVQDGMMTGGRRLQQTGTNNSLGLAQILVGFLIFQGVPKETIVDERLGAFTPRVVDIIEGILGVEVPFTCPANILAGSVALCSPCCALEDCAEGSCRNKAKYCATPAEARVVDDFNCTADKACTDPEKNGQGTCADGEICFSFVVDRCSEATRSAGFCNGETCG